MRSSVRRSLRRTSSGGASARAPVDELERAVGERRELLPVVRRDEHPPPRSRTSRAISQRRPRCAGSSEAVGSSSSRTCGPPSSASATSSRCRLPTDSDSARVGGSSNSAQSRSAPPGVGALSAREQLEVLARREPPVVRRPLRHPADARAVPLDRAAVGSRAPARIASSVDLPAPFGPTSATTSPGGERRRRCGSSATLEPKRARRPRAAASERHHRGRRRWSTSSTGTSSAGSAFPMARA